ncbi:MAG TPA: hypothetical protein VN903_06615 [Polyangia bacterium]|nr:hypothetical protein [Polyangia bacterium]
MAYRQPQLVRAWQLTARKSWNVIAWGGLLLTIGGPVCLALAKIPMPLAYPVAALPGVFLLAMWTWAGDGYRVYAGRAEMHLFEDRLEIPRARRPGVDVLPLTGLSMHFIRTRGHINFVPVSDVLVLHLASGPFRRGIAEHLVGSPEALERVAEDIGRVQRGEPPTPDPAPTPAKDSAARDALENRLDAELAKLD